MAETETAVPSPPPAPSLSQILGAHSSAPTQEQIAQWKEQWGEIYVSGFSEEDLFVFRPLRRREYKELQNIRIELQRKAAEDPVKAAEADASWEETICAKCVIWPALDITYWAEKSKAGAASTLSEQIMAHSAFLPPQAASFLVEKL